MVGFCGCKFFGFVGMEMLVLSCFKTEDTASDMSSADVHVGTEDRSVILYDNPTIQHSA